MLFMIEMQKNRMPAKYGNEHATMSENFNVPQGFVSTLEHDGNFTLTIISHLKMYWESLLFSGEFWYPLVKSEEGMFMMSIRICMKRDIHIFVSIMKRGIIKIIS